MASLFDDILVQGVRSGQIPARTQQARDWFRDKARTQRSARVYPANLMKETGNKVDRPRMVVTCIISSMIQRQRQLYHTMIDSH
jgi:hypothetical protein